MKERDGILVMLNAWVKPQLKPDPWILLFLKPCISPFAKVILSQVF